MGDRADKRTYDDACGTAHGLDLIGERWSLLVMRELLLGPRRFSDLRAALPGISANVLTQRLEGLEASGLLVRRKLPPPAASQVYELTPWGMDAEPVITTLGRWAVRSPRHDPGKHMSAVSLVLSLRTMFDSARAADLAITVGFRMDGEDFFASVRDGRLQAGRGEGGSPDLMLVGAPAAIATAIYDGSPLKELEGAGSIEASGDRGQAERFFACFPLPAKAG
ncbi:MAG: transcriptional regulator [Mesorhizobium amorphae]|nr:MAG: transcriptional regulator [Mesorhizobium amorphae]